MRLFAQLKKISVVLFLITLISCDKDFNTIGADIVGDGNLGFQRYTSENLVAYSKLVGAVQTNNLAINPLGVVNDPVFGSATANYVTQLEFVSGTNPTENIVNPVVTKVELTVPYFSKVKSTNSDGSREYVLDSLYGSGKFKLNVYESGYYLRDYDPSTNLQESQKYFSDMNAEINASKIGQRLNDDTNVSQNDEFYFDDSEVVVYEVNEDDEQIVSERLSPRMKLNLNKEFFQTKIFSAPSGTMDNNTTFKNYFRGLYFQSEANSTESSLSLLDFSQGEITIYYTVSGEDEEKTLKLKLAGNTVSLVDTQISSTISSILSNSNSELGDSRLVVRGGGKPIVSYINLFDVADVDANGVSDELDQLRQVYNDENWMINEANLVFYVDKAIVDVNPYVLSRLYLYDAVNNYPVKDYYTDQTSISGYPKMSKYYLGGFAELDSNKKPVKYKIRITEHIKNLIKNSDEKNSILGLAVTENINIIANSSLKEGQSLPSDSPYRFVPSASLVNPLGTVLFGSNTSEDKRLKLEIYYTKP